MNDRGGFRPPRRGPASLRSSARRPARRARRAPGVRLADLGLVVAHKSRHSGILGATTPRSAEWAATARAPRSRADAGRAGRSRPGVGSVPPRRVAAQRCRRTPGPGVRSSAPARRRSSTSRVRATRTRLGDARAPGVALEAVGRPEPLPGQPVSGRPEARLHHHLDLLAHCGPPRRLARPEARRPAAPGGPRLPGSSRTVDLAPCALTKGVNPPHRGPQLQDRGCRHT